MNKVLIVGRVVRDLEPRKTGSGISYVRFTVAVNREYNRDQTDFIPVVAWRNTADFAAQYVEKGTQIGVTGSFQSSSYQDQSGQNVTRYEVSADSIELLESRTQRQTREANTNEISLETTPSQTREIPTKQKEINNNDVPWDIDL